MTVEALIYGDQVRKSYDLLAYVVMGTHVHIMVRPKGELGEVMLWLKSATAYRANKLLQRKGDFWHREYYDRWMRDDKELCSALEYMAWNPVNAGLVAAPNDYPWSSFR